MPRERAELDLTESLKIDRDALDECLVEQPSLFYQVAEAVAQANSVRDGLKLELEQAEAEADREIRDEAFRLDNKVTEALINKRITSLPRIQTLQRRFLDAKTNAESKLALKEAFGQRSFMLRELVALDLAHFQNLGVERGAVSARYRIGEQNRAEAEELRRARGPRR